MAEPRSALPDARAWAGRRVLVTGHTGFKGAWLCLWLTAMGAEVSGLSRGIPTDPALFSLARVGELVAHHEGDVRDPAAVARAVAAARPEVVLHLAAQPLVRRSFGDPAGTYATNVMGTVHVLDAVRRAPADVRAVVVATSDKCYANREWEWGYREDEPMGGADPYSSSKGAAELVVAAYRASFFSGPGAPAVATARAGNVIGGGDWGADRLLPDLFRAALDEAPLRLRNPDAVRPWQHVLSPLAGYLRLAEALADGTPGAAGGWNFGPAEDDARPVRWIAERLAALWDAPLRWEADPGPHPHEAHWLKLDSSRARARLGWAPRWDLGEALARTADWYRAHRDGADHRETTLGQIRAYGA
ncbi:CDP-glucose 4,6-dehydratase [Baekduia soli]|uniref:CDP-glucose 4,6-dehydratase n=1 Tax=Baekduia soli TaxID=496014 RepID=A0A5B8U1Q6_9ACTN|nr:CDP-glucose 4,6-dehydratase [Baekduia soli]QEC46880.1 CDP-glucose 4,6-dehydratase [Baekduia soli]